MRLERLRLGYMVLIALWLLASLVSITFGVGSVVLLVITVSAIVATVVVILGMFVNAIYNRDFAPAVLVLCSFFSLWRRRNTSPCVIDDMYHCEKVAILVRDQSVAALDAAERLYARFLYSGVETLWSEAYRVIEREWIILVMQVLPALILFGCARQAFWVYKNGNPPKYSEWIILGATLCSQHLWAGVGAMFIEPTVGPLMAGSILLVLAYLGLMGENGLLPKIPVELPLFLGMVAGLLAASKLTYLPWAAWIGGAAVVCTLRMGQKLARLLLTVNMIAIIGVVLAFCIAHARNSYRYSQNPIFPVPNPIQERLHNRFPVIPLPDSSKNDGLLPMTDPRENGIWNAHPLFQRIRSRPLRVLANWIVDYKFRYPSPDPWVGTFGPFGLYLAVPSFVFGVIALLKGRSRLRLRPENTGKFLMAILALLFVSQYATFPYSHYQRYMLGQNLVILFLGAFILAEISSELRKNSIWVQRGIASIAFLLGAVQFLYSTSSPWYSDITSSTRTLERVIKKGPNS